MTARQLKVAIFAQTTPVAGGIAQALLELVSALGRLDRDESFILVTSPESADWLRPYAGPNTRLAISDQHLSYTGPAWQRQLAAGLKRHASPLLPVAESFWRKTFWALQARRTSLLAPPKSDGFIESLGADIAHFPYQRFVRTALPSIFEPWDLQHRHLPQFFSRSEWSARDVMYREACKACTVVVTASQWIRNDIVKQYAVSPSKIVVIPRGSAAAAGPDGTDDGVVEGNKLPETFALYPAQLLPHKNHLRLLEALALLRDQYNLHVNLVCTGVVGFYFSVVQQRMRTLRLDNQVRFTGHVSQAGLAWLYRHARLLVFPSLFEGYGFPLVEAMSVGLPIACSGVTSLPEIVGDAALVFDPYSVESIASAIAELWCRTEERDRLQQAERQRAQLFDPLATAEQFSDLYRQLLK